VVAADVAFMFGDELVELAFLTRFRESDLAARRHSIHPFESSA
jgi:hypothetical protein